MLPSVGRWLPGLVSDNDFPAVADVNAVRGGLSDSYALKGEPSFLGRWLGRCDVVDGCRHRGGKLMVALAVGRGADRSEEHTSELQSRQYLVCRLLLEKKKKQTLCVNTCVEL